ncbi:hypothetical protein GORBP_068_02030 [Gordonia rubripertincta NBRC 101908]|uniref:Transposase n=1 Tax=Gordonia rubripertincta NBRC 101908 TaxID=1077975 RepID=A0ABQ0HV45_GORRU|nr:hypothetical protein GORBP_068_02030 [Gordonia rubripertincta NBRC 101908]
MTKHAETVTMVRTTTSKARTDLIDAPTVTTFESVSDAQWRGSLRASLVVAGLPSARRSSADGRIKWFACQFAVP